MNSEGKTKAVVAQKGAREHYLIARSLFRNNMLAALVVDWYPKFLSRKPLPRWIRHNGTFLKAANAYCHDLPDGLVLAKNFYGLSYRIRSRFSNQHNIYNMHLKTDAHFSQMISKLDLPDHNVMICYSYAALEALSLAKKQNKLAVLDQIDPGPLERTRVVEEEKRWPHYVVKRLTINQDYEERVMKEWEIADLIIVNSKWSAQSLMRQGVPVDKIEVLPLAYDPPPEKFVHRPVPDHWTNKRKLRILWLGQVIIRKGIQYLVEAARMLQDEPVEFIIAGPIGISDRIISEAPGNMLWEGNIPRSHAAEYYKKADVFILPTLSDGFAITQLESLSFGVPVIVTPNCAQVVENEKTGFVVPAADSKALVGAVKRFLKQPDWITYMRPHCLAISDAYSLDAHSRKLKTILSRRLAGKF
jgi:glycosyltransferase involved in cell wall biosynthesis